MTIEISPLSKEQVTAHPLDVVETMLDERGFRCDRMSESMLAASYSCSWCEFGFYFAWDEDTSVMYFTCGFSTMVPEEKKSSINDLLSMANSVIPIGSFCFLDGENELAFRHTTPFRGTSGPTKEQAGDVLDTAVSECERFYPAFQFVIWGGKSADEALAMAMINPVGNA